MRIKKNDFNRTESFDEDDGEEAEVRLVGAERLAKGAVFPCALTCMTYETALDVGGAQSAVTVPDLVQLLVKL